MPQERRRSISYRSFVTCDNPKGVVECGTIRKSKINSQKKDQQHQQPSFKVVESDKRVGNPNLTNSSLGVIIKENKKEMCIQEITREVDVSKRGDKMNHVTNSRSKKKGDDHDEVIARDLLRGALDLQESLVMLGKLQEETLSSLASRSRRKHKQKIEEGSFDSMVNGVNNEKLQMEIQRPRKSVDGMKNAVRDSLLRQNVITNPIFEEHFEPRMMGFSDMPSTSSSQSSSMVRSSNFVPSESSSSSTLSQRRKKKESNLIVRLMGLESPPSSPSWHKQSENLVNLPKPMYDVDSPRARKSQCGAQVIGNKQRSIEEILETLHFKGLLRSNSMNGNTEPTLVESEGFPLKNEWYDERPPIVIMKPFGYPSRDLEEPIMPKFWLDGIKKPTSRRQSVEETVTDFGANFSEERGKFVRKAGFVRAKASVDRDQVPRKSSEAQKVSPTRRKGEESKDAKLRDELRFCNQEKLTNASQMIKQKDGKFISRQQNVSSTAVHDHGKEEIRELSEQWKRIRQSSVVDENKKGKGKVKEIEVVSTYDNKNVLPKVTSIVFDSFVELNRSRACQNHIRDYNVERLIEHDQYDKAVCDIALIDSHSPSNGYDDSHSCYSEITSVSTSEHYSPVCEVTLVTTHENGLPVHSLINKPPSFPHENEPASSKESHPSSRTKLQTLLLSDASFLSNLEEVFDLQLFPNSAPYDVGRDRILIDYAKEVMKHKSSEYAHPFLPQTWIYTKKTRNLPSLDQLLEDIKNGIEDLKCYHESASNNTFSSDYLYLKLERDLRFKSGIWEIGWRKLFSQDEIELVIREIDKLIVGNLIEEVILDLMATVIPLVSFRDKVQGFIQDSALFGYLASDEIESDLDDDTSP
ncbi:hypothetical protein KSS87_004111 [Heliosperma pusillum]|nr:hypothetical protein KSS87_004111 [Heliosperma pusillum]